MRGGNVSHRFMSFLCKLCDRELPADAFYIDPKGRRCCRCMECRAAKQREWKRTEKGRASIKAYRRSAGAKRIKVRWSDDRRRKLKMVGDPRIPARALAERARR